MGYKNLSIENRNKIEILTVNRPQALNAINTELIAELDEYVSKLMTSQNSEVRGLIVTGSGEKAFVAGADIKEMSALTVEQAQAFSQKGQAVLRKFEQLSIPVIAAVNGFALGGGMELALACDFIYASENAKFALPEVSLGLIPGFGGTVRLSRVVGLNLARELTMTGDMISASEALRVGLANKVLPLAELLPAALKTMDSVLTRGPNAISCAKSVVQDTFDLPVDAALKKEAQSFASLFSTQDTKEGLLAFIEKRKPQFVGK